MMRRTSTPRASRRTRGTALLETVIVLPSLIVVLLGAHYLFAAQRESIATLYAVRKEAWTHTIDGCNNGVGDRVQAVWDYAVELFNAAAHPDSRYVDDDAGLPGRIWGAMSEVLVDLLGSERVYTASRAAHAPSRSDDGDPSAQVATTLSVSMGCNEEPHDLGTRRSMLEWLIEFIRS